MKKDLDYNSTDPAEIKALITRFERGQSREGDAQLLGRLLNIQSDRSLRHCHCDKDVTTI